MPITILPSPPEPPRFDPATRELEEIWEALDREGRRTLLLQARAVVDANAKRVPADHPDLFERRA
jgi:hypothetical protein